MNVETSKLPPSFLIATADRRGGPVTCWSRDRLPFEPRGELLEMRAQLRLAVRELAAGAGEVLEGAYTSSSSGDVDAENVLFYNVGPGQFAAAARRGVRFERIHSPCPPPPNGAVGGAQHQVEYRIASESRGFRYWRPGVPLARWTDAPCPPLHEFTSLASVWLNLKRHAWGLAGGATATHAPFGLRVRITRGQGGASHVAAMVKPLVDGIVAAMHQHDGRDLMRLATRVAQATSADAAEIARHLRDGSRAALGARRLLWARRSSVQWNPADHRCVAAEVLIEPGAHGATNWRHSGEIVSVERV